MMADEETTFVEGDDKDDHSDHDGMSFSMALSYEPINYSVDYPSGQYSKSKGLSIRIDESTPLRGYKHVLSGSSKNEGRGSSHAFTETQSLAKFTTSSYFGFSGAAYATAYDAYLVKTFSLSEIISLDRYTPTVVSFFTIFGMIIGLSIFVLPSLVSHCGLFSVPLIATVGALSCYTSHLVHRCQYQTSKNGIRKRVYENYIDLGKSCIKWKGETLMKFLVGSSVFTDVYSLVFCSQISIDLLSKYISFDKQQWMLIWVGLVFPLFFIRRMSILAWFGFIALLFYVTALCFVFLLLIWQSKLWSWENINRKFDVQYFFVGYGVVLNTYNMHLAGPAIEASMKVPKRYPELNVISFISNTILKIFLAVAGSAAFGVATQGSLLTNLVQFGVYASVINVLIGLYMYTQYPTSMFVVFEMLDLYVLPKFLLFKKGEKSEWGWIVLSRLLLSVFIAFVAICLPNFEMLTGFIGNIRGTLTSIILPVYFYMTIHKRRLSKCSIVFHWMLIVISSLFAITGATFSVMGMFSNQ
ncbi:uncharacterized protein LOC130622104 [Hydractinia symbiolongicarpus]|uniref:uncharacterized protein LOC130622104 n=1 Tax=Hydractinia symbiolongicarpus TaxID=13093 RepID=UPI002549FEFD|nr:uncharacterized protein LOC130622104 [Hydractinia symbiolongicarpus]